VIRVIVFVGLIAWLLRCERLGAAILARFGDLEQGCYFSA
jgi:hypothetical protein